MGWSLVHAIIVSAVLGLTSGKDDDDVFPSRFAGESVLFNTSLDPAPFTTIAWSHYSKLINISIIITSSTDNFTSPEYEDRITLFMSTGSLELRNLTVNDTGQYTVTITPTEGPQVTKVFFLLVWDPVLNVTMSASATDLVEFNSSVTLTCHSPGSDLTFLWLNGSSSPFSRSSATLPIHRVRRYDTGPFSCSAYNFHNLKCGTSDGVNLTISYGPDDVTLKIQPSNEYYEQESKVNLSCLTDSRPEAEFKWLLNGELLSFTGPELALVSLKPNQSGNYSCQAFNNKTLRYTTSRPAVISVIDGPENVQISGPKEVQVKTPLKLTCSADSVPPANCTWIRNGTTIGHSSAYVKEASEYSDSGDYICRATNALTNKNAEASHTVLVTAAPKEERLSVAAIAGITVACLAAAGGAVAGGVYLYKKK